MLNELRLSTLLQAFDHFMKYEYNLQPKNPECVKLKSHLRNYLLELYVVNNSSKMFRLMDEQNQVKNSTSKEIYLQELASDLSSQVVNPLFNNQPNVISWDKFFQNSRSRCCYIPEVDGGQIVLKLPFSICNFSMFSTHRYQFKILETGETFESPEKDIRKAFLLHKRTVKINPGSCQLPGVFFSEL